MFIPTLLGDDFIDELLDTIRFEEMSGYPARKTWQEREASHQLAWEKVRRTVFEKVAASQPFTRRACDNCFSSELTSTRAVRCGTCKKHFCPMCDMKMHETDPFHKRMMVTRASKETLMASEFFDDSWNPFNKGTLMGYLERIVLIFFQQMSQCHAFYQVLVNIAHAPVHCR